MLGRTYTICWTCNGQRYVTKIVEVPCLYCSYGSPSLSNSTYICVYCKGTGKNKTEVQVPCRTCHTNGIIFFD